MKYKGQFNKCQVVFSLYLSHVGPGMSPYKSSSLGGRMSSPSSSAAGGVHVCGRGQPHCQLL